MADSKITALTSISTSTDPAVDPLVIVDVSDTSMAATGTTKKVTLNNLLSSSPTATGNFTITGDLTVDTSTLKVDSTNNRVGVGTTSPAATVSVLIGSEFLHFGFGANNDNYYTVGASGTHFWRNSGTEQMRLNSTGNLGIGVTPSAWFSTWKVLQLAGGSFGGPSDRSFSLQNAIVNASGQFQYVSGSSTPASGYRQFNGAHDWYTAAAGTSPNQITDFSSPKMTLDASGNLLVGVTSASNQERLNVSSAVSLYVARVFNTASSGGNYGIAIRYSNAAPNNGSNEFLACSDSAASRAFIYSNGGIANYQANDVSLSDSRMKSDIKPLGSYWNKIKSLEIVTFKYKDQTHNDDNIGLIAQQVESVAPELVDVDGFGKTPEDGVPLKTIYTTDLYHAAIKALQEAMTRIEALEAKLA